MANDEQYNVRKIGQFVPISDELAMEYGLIPDTRPPSPPPSRRQRIRWWVARTVRPWRLAVAARIGGTTRAGMEEVTWL